MTRPYRAKHGVLNILRCKGCGDASLDSQYMDWSDFIFLIIVDLCLICMFDYDNVCVHLWDIYTFWVFLTGVVLEFFNVHLSFPDVLFSRITPVIEFVWKYSDTF